VEPIPWVLVPARVFLVEDVIELRPQIDVSRYPELESGIQVKCSIELVDSAILLQVSGSTPGKEISLQPEILYYQQAKRCIQLERKEAICLCVIFQSGILVEV